MLMVMVVMVDGDGVCDVGLTDVERPTCESSSEFMCVSDGVCINKVLHCDGVDHCADRSDELACNYTG